MKNYNKNKNHLELVAPAGSLEKLKYAVEYGADAVYCGVPDFSLRARINSFTEKEILEGIRFAHERKKKIYITTNIFAHNKHVNKLPEFLKIFKDSNSGTPVFPPSAYACCCKPASLAPSRSERVPKQVFRSSLPDAFIASDPGIIATIKEKLPNAKIHLSTQANCTNWRAAKFWYDSGVKRVVLGREVRLEDVKEIKKRVPKLELEVFVHGAMCMSYSGRCFLSAWMSRRSANLGDCAQSCRWQYHLVEQLRPGEYMPVEQDQHGTYLLNSKDLCLIEYLKKLKDAGVDSFKIEGRGKSVYYLASVVGAYRSVIDANFSVGSVKKAKEELEKNTNRGYTTGFLLGKEDDKNRNDFQSRSLGSDWEFVGEVVNNVIPMNSKIPVFPPSAYARCCEPAFLAPSRSERVPKQAFCDSCHQHFLVFKAHNALKVGDKIEILQPGNKIIKTTVEKLILLKNGKEVPEAHGGHGGRGDLFVLPTKEKVEGMGVIRRKKPQNIEHGTHIKRT